MGAHNQWSAVSELFGDLQRRDALGSWWNSEAEMEMAVVGLREVVEEDRF